MPGLVASQLGTPSTTPGYPGCQPRRLKQPLTRETQRRASVTQRGARFREDYSRWKEDAEYGCVAVRLKQLGRKTDVVAENPYPPGLVNLLQPGVLLQAKCFTPVNNEKGGNGELRVHAKMWFRQWDGGDAAGLRREGAEKDRAKYLNRIFVLVKKVIHSSLQQLASEALSDRELQIYFEGIRHRTLTGNSGKTAVNMSRKNDTAASLLLLMEDQDMYSISKSVSLWKNVFRSSGTKTDLLAPWCEWKARKERSSVKFCWLLFFSWNWNFSDWLQMPDAMLAQKRLEKISLFLYNKLYVLSFLFWNQSSLDPALCLSLSFH
ncbi:uncharacterized protein V6R79_012111 [Siganus canaliculatus]